MILHAIGVAVSPLVIAYKMVDSGYFIPNIWQSLSVHGTGFLIYCVFEFLTMIAFVLYATLVALFFFNTRSGTPKLMIGFMAVSLLVLIIEGYVQNQFFHELGFDPLGSDIVKSAFYAAIWIPYYLKSSRVKRTFTNHYLKPLQSEAPILPETLPIPLEKSTSQEAPELPPLGE